MPILFAINCKACGDVFSVACEATKRWQVIPSRDCKTCGFDHRVKVSIRASAEKEDSFSVRSQAPGCHEDLALTINSSGGGGSSSPVPVMSADPHRDRVRSAPPQGTNRIGKAGVAPSPPEPLKQLLKKGRPRLGEVRPKPWIKAGMSERTWYRRQKEKIGGTNPS